MTNLGYHFPLFIWILFVKWFQEFFNNQEPSTLLEYSMSAVTEGIDAIATTRVVIRGEKNPSLTHAVTGETVQRTFRYEMR